MIIDQNGNVSIITQEKTTVVELVKKLQTLYPKFKNNNLIIVLTALEQIKSKAIIEFLYISNSHKADKKSFVIVSNKVDLDSIPDEITIVPTIQEAYDIIEMEDMERDLGF